jgi:biotin synthase
VPLREILRYAQDDNTAINKGEPMKRQASDNSSQSTGLRHDWSRVDALALFALPFNDLIFEAQQAHRRFFDPNAIHISTLLSIKTGGCAEDCSYCPQSAHFDTGLKASKLMDVEAITAAARRAKESGAGRFCMGAAWRSPKERDMPKLTEIIREVKALGLETCATLGMVTPEQAGQLKDAGLDYYNHNLDTSEEFYPQIITTRTYQNRLDTLAAVREAGMHVCCGGIVGMGESLADRADLLVTLANQSPHPESVPINLLVQVEGTPLAQANAVDPIDFVRTIAVARILMPGSHVRLSAGREQMSDEIQALCFLAGANSIFYGDTLLTTSNPQMAADQALMQRLGLHAEGKTESHEGRDAA